MPEAKNPAENVKDPVKDPVQDVIDAKDDKKPVPEDSVQVAMRTKDGEPRQGSLVKAGSLVKTAGAYFMVDTYTLTRYDQRWTEAVPSPWLDGQFKAGKIEVK